MNPIDRVFVGLKADIDIILDGLEGLSIYVHQKQNGLKAKKSFGLWK